MVHGDAAQGQAREVRQGSLPSVPPPLGHVVPKGGKGKGGKGRHPKGKFLTDRRAGASAFGCSEGTCLAEPCLTWRLAGPSLGPGMTAWTAGRDKRQLLALRAEAFAA